MPTYIYEACEQLIRGIVDNTKDGNASHTLLLTCKKIHKHVQGHKPLEVAFAIASDSLGDSLETNLKLESKCFTSMHVQDRPLGITTRGQ